MGDVGGSELLCLAGQTLDRAEELAERIRADGVMIRTATGAKAHPCVKDELAARNLTARLLARLSRFPLASQRMLAVIPFSR
jgi:hypothetical protein